MNYEGKDTSCKSRQLFIIPVFFFVNIGAVAWFVVIYVGNGKN